MIYQEPLTTDFEQRKAQGWVLSVDPASNSAGVSLWNDGKLIAFETLNSYSKFDSISNRLKAQNFQLTHFLRTNGFSDQNKIKKVIFEGVRSRIVTVTIGAYIVCPFIDAKLNTDSFIESSSWKYHAKNRGAKGVVKDIKGIQALKDINFPVEKLTSDDVADSILIYLTWVHRR